MILNAKCSKWLHRHQVSRRISSSVFEVVRFYLSAIERRRHPVDNGIEQLLNAFVFEGRSAKNRIEFVAANPFSDGSIDFFRCQRIWIFQALSVMKLHSSSSIVASSSSSSARIFLHFSRRSAGISVSSQSAPKRFIVEK